MNLGKYLKKNKNEVIPQKMDPFFSKFETDPYVGPKVEKGIDFIAQNELNQILIDSKVLAELMSEVDKTRQTEKALHLKDQEILSWRTQLDDMKIKYNEIKKTTENKEIESQLERDILKRKIQELSEQILEKDKIIESQEIKIKEMEHTIEKIREVREVRYQNKVNRKMTKSGINSSLRRMKLISLREDLMICSSN